MEVQLKERRGEIEVTLSAMLHGRDGVFWLHGGEVPHIGAISIGTADGSNQLITFPGHREDVIVAELARQLKECRLLDHTVICGGIHYDRIPKAWLPEITAACRTLGERLLAELPAAVSTQQGGTQI